MSERNLGITVYGNGSNIREWLYVLDHCKAIDIISNKGRSGAMLDEKRPRKNVAHYEKLMTFVSDLLGHDQRYVIDPTKIMTELGWKSDENFDSGIVKTVDWYLKALI